MPRPEISPEQAKRFDDYFAAIMANPPEELRPFLKVPHFLDGAREKAQAIWWLEDELLRNHVHVTRAAKDSLAFEMGWRAQDSGQSPLDVAGAMLAEQLADLGRAN